jgi:hypothetical protein
MCSTCYFNEVNKDKQITDCSHEDRPH